MKLFIAIMDDDTANMYAHFALLDDSVENFTVFGLFGEEDN